MGYLEPEDHGRIIIQDNVLIITQVDDERDPGMYQCRASNTLKTRYSSAQLRVLGIDIKDENNLLLLLQILLHCSF